MTAWRIRADYLVIPNIRHVCDPDLSVARLYPVEMLDSVATACYFYPRLIQELSHSVMRLN